MNNHFHINYKKIAILVEPGNTNSYVLKYPDGKFIMLDREEREWVVEDRSGDYWSNEDIQAIGQLLDEKGDTE